MSIKRGWKLFKNKILGKPCISKTQLLWLILRKYVAEMLSESCVKSKMVPEKMGREWMWLAIKHNMDSKPYVVIGWQSNWGKKGPKLGVGREI